MAGFIDEISAAPAAAGMNYKAINNMAIKEVLPIIIERDLTEKQRICIKKRYYEGKTQSEIAEELLLTQPTVSRHIQTAQKIIQNRLYYCGAALDKAQRLIETQLH